MNRPLESPLNLVGRTHNVKVSVGMSEMIWRRPKREKESAFEANDVQIVMGDLAVNLRGHSTRRDDHLGGYHLGHIG